MTDTYQITSDYFTAGILVNNQTGKVRDAAPILKYMKGWHITYVDYYVNKKGWYLARAET